MRKLIVLAAAALGISQATAAPVVYNITGSIGGNDYLLTDNALTAGSTNFWNPQDGSSLTSCPGTLYSCTNTAATGDALGVGPSSGSSTGITGTVAPTFSGTLTIDTTAGTVEMDITFDGTVTFRNPDIFPPAPFSGAAVSEITNWNQTVTWTTGTVGAASGSVTRGNIGGGTTSSGTQVCDWNNADATTNATLCASRVTDAADRSWGTTRNQISGTGLVDCTNGTPGDTGNYTACAAQTAAGNTGDTNVDYTVTGSNISGSGGYLERAWNGTAGAPFDRAYGLCTAGNVSLNQFSCASRWEGAIREEVVSGGTTVNDSVQGGSITFSGTLAAIPVPAAVWLFGSALGLLGWIRRRVSA